MKMLKIEVESLRKFDVAKHENTKHAREEYFIKRGGNLLTANSSSKASKSSDDKHINAMMYLLPADAVDGMQLCPYAVKAGCKAGCLNTAGRGAFNNVQLARKRKTELLRDSPDLFYELLNKDIERLQRKAIRESKTLAVRLNGTSDIVIERVWPELFQRFSDVQFYDYTKIFTRAGHALPDNYNLTLSYSAADNRYASNVIKYADKHNVNYSVVFRDSLPATFNGRTVINGDVSDLRFNDPTGVIVGLTAKGKARKDTSGFVVESSL